MVVVLDLNTRSEQKMMIRVFSSKVDAPNVSGLLFYHRMRVLI